MRFAFTEEQTLFRQALRDMLEKECTAGHVRAAWSSDDGRVPGLWAQLAQLGIVGLTVPERFGGLGLTALDLVLLLEESGRAALPEPLLETTAVAVPLLCGLEEPLQARWLEPIATGSAVVTIGLEAAPFVPYADVADLLILQRGDQLHAVTPDQFQLTRQASVDGARRLFSVAWEPNASSLVARGARAQLLIAAALEHGALAAAAQLLGLARQMIDLTVVYAKVREQFGKPIGSFQAIKHHLADALLKLEFACPVVYRAAYSVARGHDEHALHVSMAKASASDAAMLAARTALQCHGAIGYATEHDLHLWMKRAWALAAAWGDASWHRQRVGAAIL